MKYLIFALLAIGVCMSSFSQQANCDNSSFDLAGRKWFFPSTVKEAFETHKLSYKPPGYYYKTDSLGMELILSYHFIPLDFDDEYQPKEVLFPRKLHSYIFRFPDKPGLYDSLKTSLENTYRTRFILTKGLKDKDPTLNEEDRPFEFNFLTVNPCLTIGIKRSLPMKKEKIVTVRFMFDLPLAEMGLVMGSY